MRYQGNCVTVGAGFIWALRTAPDARRISLATMRRRAPGLLWWAERHGYDKRAPGVTLAADPLVTYHKATVCGRVCYWLVWSGFEHVWAPGDVRAWWA